ncbi:MAG: aminoacyl-histidine dipeptidase [Bacteroidales bacterium]|nr:aminoacyl-histidine dipeptidase [Bacteroidales bacterium]
MTNNIRNLEPKIVWEYFDEICQVPRPSKKEAQIIKYLKDFGSQFQLETLEDETGNILIRKGATKGYENRPWVVLQSHMDMVCEKNSDVDFDFEKDAIIPIISGEWVKAQGTTLGADDGIGVAAQLAILASNDIEHGPIECLFTVDEETGLTGAFGLKPGFVKSEILLNLDSEDEGELFIGCAGGVDTIIEMEYESEKSPKDYKFFKLTVNGLNGGHSGDEIQKGLGNAVKLMNRILWEASHKTSLRIVDFRAGNLRNAIAREGFAHIAIAQDQVESFISLFDTLSTDIKSEYSITEKNLKITCEATEETGDLMIIEYQNSLLNALYGCPHGVIAWSQSIDNFVETSTNLASIKMKDHTAYITTSQRSSVESARTDIANMVAANFRNIGAYVEHTDGYPGWAPNPKSKVLEQTEKSYTKLFKVKPKVLAIHAGLECGLIGETYPKMDMISFGPTIKGAHSPDERIKIDTVKMFWDLTLDVLKNI